jgi:hypothetical protein
VADVADVADVAPSRHPKRRRDETKAAVSTDRVERRGYGRIGFIIVSPA